MKKFRNFVFGWSLLFVCSCSFGTMTLKEASEYMSQMFAARLSELAGKQSVKCGHFGRDQIGTKALECAKMAEGARRAFSVSATAQGIDSLLYRGIAVNSKGEKFLVIGDLDVRGRGGRSAKPAVFAFECKGPSVFSDAETLFECAHREEINQSFKPTPSARLNSRR